MLPRSSSSTHLIEKSFAIFALYISEIALSDFASQKLMYFSTRCSLAPRLPRISSKSPSQYLLKAVPSKLNNLMCFFFPENHWSSVRPISIGQLNMLPCLHLRPINVIVSHGSYHFWRRSILVGGFALRCFQRLSRPYVATQLCPWQNNWCTRGMSIPVLSY